MYVILQMKVWMDKDLLTLGCIYMSGLYPCIDVGSGV